MKDQHTTRQLVLNQTQPQSALLNQYQHNTSILIAGHINLKHLNWMH